MSQTHWKIYIIWQLQTCHILAECIYVSKILEGELHKLEQGTDKGGLIGGVT